MSDGVFLARLGTDAAKWVEAYLEGEAGDSERLFGWFANAIEAGRSAGFAEGQKRSGEKPVEIDGVGGWNCGNRFLAAERILRIVENSGFPFGPDDLARLDELADQAGPRLCREALQPDIPF